MNDNDTATEKRQSTMIVLLSLALIISSINVAFLHWRASHPHRQTPSVKITGKSNRVIAHEGAKVKIAVGSDLIDANGRTCNDYPAASVCMHSDTVLAVKKDDEWFTVAGRMSAADLKSKQLIDNGTY
jgi:hypothetical protein